MDFSGVTSSPGWQVSYTGHSPSHQRRCHQQSTFLPCVGGVECLVTLIQGNTHKITPTIAKYFVLVLIDFVHTRNCSGETTQGLKTDRLKLLQTTVETLSRSLAYIRV